MKITHDTIRLDTQKPIEFIDITDDTARILKNASVKNGLLNLSSEHTTCAVCINENCERLQKDMENFLKKLAPPNDNYHHNHQTIDDRSNAHSHLMSLFLKTTESVQIKGNRLSMGAWQRVFFVELDGPRKGRKINITIIGE